MGELNFSELEWKRCTFTVFNDACERGWPLDVRNRTGEEPYVDDCEFAKVGLGDVVRNSVIAGDRSVLDIIERTASEFNAKNYPDMAMYLMGDIGLLYVIRNHSGN